MVQLSHSYITTRKTIALTTWTFVGKVMSVLFNALPRFYQGFPSKEQASFNFTAAVTVCRDSGAQENKTCHSFHVFLFYLPWSVSMWNEHTCTVVWTCFGIVLLWYWDENWPFPVLGHCWVFQICWHIECSTFKASSFRIWKSSTGIPSPPLAVFVVILPKVYLTSRSRMSGSRWVTPSLWLSG